MPARGTDVPEGLRVGILGGGQLARMLALAGIPLGCDFVFLDPSPNACAARAGRLIQAGFSDLEAVRSMAAEIDVATFDFENVSADSARALAELRPLRPSVAVLEQCQDRLAEKDLLGGLEIPVPAYRPVASRPELLAAVETIGLPAVLKTRRLGYDGKGQVVLRSAEDLEHAWHRLGDSGLILEEFIPFSCECSLLTARSARGEVRSWELTRNVHADGVLTLSMPGGFSGSVQRQAEEISQRLLEHWQYVGVMAVEFFVHDGSLLVNEIAPRVHNSGHWTIDAAETSQFENHLRAILGWPLGDTAMTSDAVMFNWIGSLPEREQLLSTPGLHQHDYGKTARPGRKLGHATLTAADRHGLLQRSTALAAQLEGDWPKLLSSLFAAA